MLLPGVSTGGRSVSRSTFFRPPAFLASSCKQHNNNQHSSETQTHDTTNSNRRREADLRHHRVGSGLRLLLFDRRYSRRVHRRRLLKRESIVHIHDTHTHTHTQPAKTNTRNERVVTYCGEIRDAYRWSGGECGRWRKRHVWRWRQIDRLCAIIRYSKNDHTQTAKVIYKQMCCVHTGGRKPLSKPPPPWF
jgi:hypothetical protein